MKHPFSIALTALLMSPCSLTADDLTELQQRAAGGDAKAQIELAICYRDGKGIDKDDVEAMQWAHRAADAGNVDAMDFVGFAYLRGAVIKRNPTIAFGYFKSAANDSAQAAFNLGQCYFGAQGTEQDCAKALAWWTKAAEKGHGRAAASAAMAYLSGEGVPANPTLGRRLAERAAELNNPSGLVVLGELQFQAGDV
ncbi:MAG: sel1 repeat family protein, partial [Verrucomicrobiales bacterium]|nr:sel1 repeat family protein [Verrucomicrobiales bacterium]